MEPFSNEYISKYSKYFNTPKVIDAADKLFDAITVGEELNNDEKQASLSLALIKLQNIMGEINNDENKMLNLWRYN